MTCAKEKLTEPYLNPRLVKIFSSHTVIHAEQLNSTLNVLEKWHFETDSPGMQVLTSAG